MKKIIQFLPLLLLALACNVDPEPVDDRKNFEGKFEVEDYLFLLDSYSDYQITIDKSRFEDDTIFIHNLYDVRKEIVAEVSGSKMFIPQQQIDDFEFEGLGSINVDKYDNVQKLTIFYTVKWLKSPNQRKDSCRAECIKF